MSDRYAVVGNPIGHSKSPLIHAAFAAATGQDIEYTALLAPLDGFRATVEDFRAHGGLGLNVTVPFKNEAWEYAHARSTRAEAAGAVNTLSFQGREIFGDNTDGVGLVRDLRANHGITISERRVLLLGAGGAAQGVLLPLLEERPARLFIANRTAGRAAELADRFSVSSNGESGTEIATTELAGGGFEAIGGERFDLIINATAASLNAEGPPLPDGVLAKGGVCYDMMYSDRKTAFVEWGEQRGAALSLDGLGMLVEQAAESFFIWRGLRPETRGVIAALRRGDLKA